MPGRVGTVPDRAVPSWTVSQCRPDTGISLFDVSFEADRKEASAGEVARQTATEHEQLNGDLMKQMKTCSGNYT